MASLLNLLAMQGNPMAGLLASRQQSAEESPALLTARQRGVPTSLLGGAPNAPSGPASVAAGPPVAPPGLVAPANPGGATPGMAGAGPGGGIGGALAALVGGEPNPDLTPEQNEALRKQAFITAGLAMMADDDGGVGAIARGMLMGRAVTGEAQEKMAEKNEERLRRLQAEALVRKRNSILAQINPLDPNARMDVVGQLLAMGDLEAADKFLELDKRLAGRAFEDQARIVREDIVSETDRTSPESLLQAALRFSAAGMTGDAQELRLQADSLRAIMEYRGALTWRDVGDRQIALDRDGNVVMELRNTMSPAEAAAYMLNVRKTEEARAAGATDDYLRRLNQIGDDFRIDARNAATIAAFYRNALAAQDNAVGDLTLIMSINKLLDPEGVVREGEFDRVARAGGLYDRFAGVIEKTKDGRIPAPIRAQVMQEIRNLAEESRAIFESQVLPIYLRQTEIAEINPEDVLYNPFGGPITSSLSRYR